MSSPRNADDERVTGLALAAGRGDRDALEAWIRATQADVWRFLAHLADVRSADDLTQETYLRALASLPRFAGRSSSRTWVLAIARRVAVDQIRSAAARPRVADADWETVAERAAARATTGFEDLVELRMLLSGLDEQRREVLVLTQVLGMSYQDAAQVCGVPVGTIRSRVARAREDLLAADREADNGAG
ncbi:RNA polymerase sigma factor SigC [Amycolatopsis cihanbeyliensis]|uniref:RNA polymerase sigma-70 factor (ECF subfamily) n=1 Tax=Amycolatopsis cihanbeyliensis TaxID=1128664 RepID=A0A542DNE3_AMYCI|nr:RNA polymerase sigma factor SigC [Amycolatopsis cihanbeyliensis]TQJ04606.1 RNA polymerase sigma-70 factor (ECF subfamily) [Amycolatopsis cihanbeyliensis]